MIVVARSSALTAHCYASTALAEGIPITEVSRWLGHRNIEIIGGEVNFRESRRRQAK
jgi:hypothetical protein